MRKEKLLTRSLSSLGIRGLFRDRSVGTLESYAETAEKKVGINSGYWAANLVHRDESMIKFFDLQISSNSDADAADEKISNIMEFVSADLFSLLLPNRTPNIKLLVVKEEVDGWKQTDCAIASKKLEGFRTILDLFSNNEMKRVNAEAGFEKYVAASLFLGNLDWGNLSNFGLKADQLAAIDFGLAFFIKFDSVPLFLSHVAKCMNCDMQYKGLAAFKMSTYFDFRLQNFRDAIDEILRFSPELLKSVIRKKVDILKRHDITWDVQDAQNITINNVDRDFSRATLNLDLESFEEFEIFLEDFIDHQFKFFAKVRDELDVIAKYNRRAEYFNGRWIQHYAKRPTEAVAHAALHKMKIEGSHALDWAEANNKLVFGTHPLSGVMSYCHHYGISNPVFRGGIVFVPLNDRKKDYTTLDPKMLYVMHTTLNADTYIIGVESYAVYITEEIEAALKEKSIVGTRMALNDLRNKLTLHMSMWNIDIYTLLFMSHVYATVFINDEVAMNVNDIRCALMKKSFDFMDLIRVNGYAELSRLNGLSAGFVEFFDQNKGDKTMHKEHASRLVQYLPFGVMTELLTFVFKEKSESKDVMPMSVERYSWGLGMLGKFLFEVAPTTIAKGNTHICALIDGLKREEVLTFDDHREAFATRFKSKGCAVIDVF